MRCGGGVVGYPLRGTPLAIAARVPPTHGVDAHSKWLKRRRSLARVAVWLSRACVNASAPGSVRARMD